MPDNRPNILLLMTDQQRLDTIASLGGMFGAHTPAMDSLVREGVSFDRAYCTAPICGPSRATIMTGLTPTQAGIPGNLGNPCSPLANSKLTIADRLQAVGYETAYFGKWHLGGDLKEYGWEHAFETGYDEDALQRACAFYRRDWIVNKRPWFQVVSLLNPHDLYFYDPADTTAPPAEPWPSQRDDLETKPWPQRFHARPDWTRARWASLRNFYRQCIERVDRQIAELLHQHRCGGFAPNTWIIFTADHGDTTGEHHLPFKGPWMYEPVLKVPLVIVPPRERFVGKGRGNAGSLEPFKGRRCSDVVSLVDLVPTILDLAGTPKDESLQGMSLLPLAASQVNREAASGDRAVYAEWLQSGKLVSPIRTIVTQRWKFSIYLGYGHELYDLQADPHELKNLASDPAHTTVRQDLDRRLREQINRTNDPFFSLTPTDEKGVALKQ
jgi:arylsulfatase A-like enzyme